MGSINLNAVQSGNLVTITFIGGGPIGIDPAGSLKDGAYQLTIFAGNVQGAGGSLDGNGDGIGGDNYLTPTAGNGRIFRLFGDADGTGTVDAIDFGGFLSAFGTANPIYDFDGGGTVDAIDFGQFLNRFGTGIP